MYQGEVVWVKVGNGDMVEVGILKTRLFQPEAYAFSALKQDFFITPLQNKAGRVLAFYIGDLRGANSGAYDREFHKICLKL
jgi:hypothetical protein